jgi:hypothetical protein
MSSEKRTKKKRTVFYQSTLKTMMKENDDVGSIHKTVLLGLSRALELYIADVVAHAFDAATKEKGANASELKLEHVHHVIETVPTMDFLRFLIDNDSDDSSSSSSDSSSDSD